MYKKTILSKLPRLSIGLLFLVAGLMKLFMISPAMFAKGMIEPGFGMIGLTGGGAIFIAWVITFAEVFGGLALLVGKKVPAKITKVLITILVIVLVGAIIFIHVRGGEIMTALKDIVLLAVLLSLCPKKCCVKKTCTDGTCEA